MTIFQVAEKWLAQDPDAETRAELEQLIQAAQKDEKQKQNQNLVLMGAYNSVLQVYVADYKPVQWG